MKMSQGCREVQQPFQGVRRDGEVRGEAVLLCGEHLRARVQQDRGLFEGRALVLFKPGTRLHLQTWHVRRDKKAVGMPKKLQLR